MIDQTVLLDWTLDIDVDHVLRGQGADPDNLRRRRPRVVEIAQRALDDGFKLIAPSAIVRELPVIEVRHDRLILADGTPLRSSLLAEQLASAQRVAVIVCTIGPVLEQRASALMATDPAYALALDAFGSVAVDALGAAVCNRLEARAALNHECVSPPLGPGLLGWPVDVGQPQLFGLVEADAIGVTLLPSCQMMPYKSASMLVGFAAQPFQAGRVCDFCGLRQTCRYQQPAARPT